MKASPPRAKRRRRRDFGRGFSLFMCVLFAIVGAVPLAVGLLVRTEMVRSWAAGETASLLASELGLVARYDVEVDVWPMQIRLSSLTVDASDGGEPFLRVERISVHPRPFSLLAGKLDVGDVEIVGPRIRAVVKDGELQNLALTLPETSDSEGPTRAPFSSVAITDAQIDAIVDDAAVSARELDVDVSVEEESAFEIALRTGRAVVTRVHPVVGFEDSEDQVDEDVICRLDARVRADADGVRVRRLNLRGAVDFDPDPGTRPPCDLPESDWRNVELRLGAFNVGLREGGFPNVQGRIRARIPAALAHRFVFLPHATGSIGLDVEIDREGDDPLPELRGRIHADTPGIDGKVFAHQLDAEVSIHAGVVRLENADITWGDGRVTIAEATLDTRAPGMALQVGPVDLRDLDFPGVLRDLGAHPASHVAWALAEGRFERFGGTLDPLRLEGPLVFKSHSFEIFDRPASDPGRVHMMGVKEGVLRGNFVVREGAVVFSNFAIDTPRSHMRTTVTLDLRQLADVEVFDDTRIDLADISPLARVPIAGMLSLSAESHGRFEDPHVEGDIAIKDFALGGFSAGDIESAKVSFAPLVVRLADLRLRKNQSRLRAPLVSIDFDAGADIVVDADLDTREAPHMAVHDLFKVFHFDKDPRWEGVGGVASGTARVHYALGGREDRCGGGLLDVRSRMALSQVELFGETYDDGAMDVDFTWDDQAAGASGMEIDVRSASLHKGQGTVLGNARVRHGGVLDGSVIANAIPLARLDVLGAAGKMFDGHVSAVATIGGTVTALESLADVSVSRVRIGPDSLPASRFRFAIESAPDASPDLGKTACGNRRAGELDLAEFSRDVSAGLFRATGQLFDGQLVLDDVRMTRQRHAIVEGTIVAQALNLGTLSNLIPGVAFASATPTGALSATATIRSLPLDRLRDADVTLELEKLSVAREGFRAALSAPSGPIVLKDDQLSVPDLRLALNTSSGLTTTFVAGGTVSRVATEPDLDLALRLEPLSLAALAADIKPISRASGTARAALRVLGPPSAPRYEGSAEVRRGELDFRDPKLSMEGLEIDVTIGGGEVRVTRAVANVGGGTLAVKARMPLRGLEVGTAVATITARGVKVPVADGVQLTADADVEATFLPWAGPTGDEANLPWFEGTVSLASFSYTRPISLNVDLGQLTGRTRRTEVDTYDPRDDVARFNIRLVSPKPLRFSNNLVDMELDIAPPGLVLSGTNQRYGARGLLNIVEGSKITLRSSEFEVREGLIRFDNPSRIAPNVDLRAVTEYRRYASAATSDAAASEPGATSGQWRVNLHASGDVQDLKVDFTSDPPLSQEDIVLLLTFGTTRAELDRALAGSIGGTVGLEALSALTGADKAVKTIVPIIDDFRLGSAYSSRSGRIEPTVTLGKRVTTDVRAAVTTGLSESREVRSSVEWRLNRRVSVQGSYDNANDASSSSVGNIGADLRLRLEFE